MCELITIQIDGNNSTIWKMTSSSIKPVVVDKHPVKQQQDLLVPTPIATEFQKLMAFLFHCKPKYQMELLHILQHIQLLHAQKNALEENLQKLNQFNKNLLQHYKELAEEKSAWQIAAKKETVAEEKLPSSLP